MRFLEYVLAGLGVGVVFGLFGAGGSAFATPVLAVLGVPGLLAVASPLPAMVPAAFVSARRYLKAGNLDRRVAQLAIGGGVPGTLLGALASRFVGGGGLLVLSGLLLLGIGVRMLLPDRAGAAERCAGRRENSLIVVGSALVVGLLTGLLANGGGFLLVPVFVLVLGLSAVEAAGTSMVVVGVPDRPDTRQPLGARPHRLGRRRGFRPRPHPGVTGRRPALAEGVLRSGPDRLRGHVGRLLDLVPDPADDLTWIPPGVGLPPLPPELGSAYRHLDFKRMEYTP